LFTRFLVKKERVVVHTFAYLTECQGKAQGIYKHLWLQYNFNKMLVFLTDNKDLWTGWQMK